MILPPACRSQNADIVAGVAVIATSEGGIGLTSLAPDIAVLGTLLNRNVREWCSRPGQAEREWYSGSAR